jgi:hypothetical protein
MAQGNKTSPVYQPWIDSDSKRRMADDFRLFLWYLWRELGLPEPTPVQYDIAVYLQHGPRRRIIEAFRGVGKSWITAAFVLWLLWKNPNERIMVVSANEDRAISFGLFVRKLIDTIDILSALRPKGGDRDSATSFDVGPAGPDQAPSVRCVGITGQLTGGRASVIVADDVEIPKNSATELQREKISEAVKEFDAVLKPDGDVIYLGTPQVQQSLYVQLEKRGYVTRIWPARYTADVARYRGLLAPWIAEGAADPAKVGKSTEPTRFTEFDLMEREASYGRSGFALQFMLDTALSDSDRHPLKIGDLLVLDLDKKLAPVACTWASGQQQVIDGLPNVAFNGERYHRPMYVSPDFVPYQGAVMHIDPSGRGKDETAYSVTKMLNGMIYTTRWGGLKGGFDGPTLEALAHIAREEAVNEVSVEENFGAGMYKALLEPVINRIYPVTVSEFRVKGRKEQRICDVLEPVLNQHRLVIDKKIIERDYEDAQEDIHYSGLYQLSHLTRDPKSLKHDDRVDVLAAAAEYWTKSVQMDTAKAEERHREKAMKAELAKFMKQTIGARPRGRRWVNI